MSEPSLERSRPPLESPDGGESGDAAREEKHRHAGPWRGRRARSSVATPPPASTPPPPRRGRTRLKTSLLARRHPATLALAGSLALLALLRAGRVVVVLYLGPRGSVKGGLLGGFVDQLDRDCAARRTRARWRAATADLGLAPGSALPDPWTRPLDPAIRSRPHLAVAELLARERRRRGILAGMAARAERQAAACAADGGAQDSLVGVPGVAAQWPPMRGSPDLLPHWIARAAAPDVDAVTLRRADADLPALRPLRDCRTPAGSPRGRGVAEEGDDAELRCAMYRVGGMQWSGAASLQRARPLVERIFSWATSPDGTPRHAELGGGTCRSRVGYAVLAHVSHSRKTSAAASRVATVFTAFPPSHPGFLCLPPLQQTVGISPYDEANAALSPQSPFVNRLLTEMVGGHVNATGTVWGVATLRCNADESGPELSRCCNEATIALLDPIDAGTLQKDLEVRSGTPRNNQQAHHMIFTFATSAPAAREDDAPRGPSEAATAVTIRERSHEAAPAGQPKASIQRELDERNCKPGWFCHRCLHSSAYGSFAACGAVCDACLGEIVCAGRDADAAGARPVVALDVRVARPPRPVSALPPARRIPRIVHQTYFEDLDPARHPQLHRLQTAWRASGWEHRFYTDEDARRYVAARYPPRFAAAFDALRPGAYKVRDDGRGPRRGGLSRTPRGVRAAAVRARAFLRILPTYLWFPVAGRLLSLPRPLPGRRRVCRRGRHAQREPRRLRRPGPGLLRAHRRRGELRGRAVLPLERAPGRRPGPPRPGPRHRVDA